MDAKESLPCPFCEFEDADAYFLAQHVELCHPENGSSPFIAPDDEQHTGNTRRPEWWHGEAQLFTDEDAEPATKYIDCPTGCGEAVTEDQLTIHLDLHLAEGLALEELKGIQPKSQGAEYPSHIDLKDHEDEELFTKLSNTFRKHDGKRFRDAPIHTKPPKKGPMAKPRRLGTAELGPYARELKMPYWLRKMLEEGPEIVKENRILPDGTLQKVEVVSNETPGLIPVISRLCQQDDSVEQAFLCSSNVRHIFKMRKEGGFCGYRNIQMLISYLQDSHAEGSKHFPGRTPSILRLQNMIEKAWDNGFNSHGRIETGGIKGTRKYIGTSEAAALFQHLEIPCRPVVCVETSEDKAYEALFLTVAEYFIDHKSPSAGEQIVQTELPPIYLQHKGHSLTIIGLELRKDGSANLLVFDPSFKTSAATSRLRGSQFKASKPEMNLKAFRRNSRYLRQYDVFELLITIMRTSPNIIITGTPGVGKTVHCEHLAQETDMKHLSINQIAKEQDCYDGYDEKLKSHIVDEDKLLDAIEAEVLKGGYLIDWHACDLFPKSWIDLVVVLRCPSTSILYDRLASRSYSEEKLQENLDAEIFEVLLEEAKEAYDEEIVVELQSETDDAIESNCQRIISWIENWKQSHTADSN